MCGPRRSGVGLGAAVALLVVGGEVLDGGDDALVLRPLDPAHRHLGVQERVLPVPLERPTSYGRSHDVHRRRVDEVVALLPGLVPGHGAGLAGQLRLPGRGQRKRRRKRGCGALSDSGRTVVEVEPRDPHTRYAGARGAVLIRAAGLPDVGKLVPGEQRDLLLPGHGLEQQVGALVGREGRVAPRPRRRIAAGGHAGGGAGRGDPHDAGGHGRSQSPAADDRACPSTAPH